MTSYNLSKHQKNNCFLVFHLPLGTQIRITNAPQERVEGGPGPDGGVQEAVAVQDERYRAVGDEDETNTVEQSVQGE